MATIEKKETKKGTAYVIRVSNGRSLDGKQHRIKTTFYPTKKSPRAIEKEVQAFAIQFEKQYHEGETFTADKLTFEKLVEYWKTWAVDNLTESVIDTYEGTLKKHIYPKIGTTKLSKFTPMYLQAFFDEKKKEGLAPATLQKIKTVMSSVLSYAEKKQIIDDNPCRKVDLPKIPHDNDLHYFDYDQAQRFLNCFDMTFYSIHAAHTRVMKSTGQSYEVPEYVESHTIPYMWKAYFFTSIISGMRRGEEVSLLWKDIDFDENVIHVHHATAQTKKHGQVEKNTKSEAGYRDIDMPSQSMDLLRRWYDDMKEYAVQIGDKWKGKPLHDFENQFVFIQDNGKQMHLSTPTHKFPEIIDMYNAHIDYEKCKATDAEELTHLESLKLPHIRLHDLRHSCATILINSGVNIEVVSHRLGHSKVSLDLDRYGHAMRSKSKEASSILASVLQLDDKSGYAI